MTMIERSILIKATPEEIETIHNDIDRLPEWYAGIEKAISDGIYPNAGGKVRLIYKAAGITFEMTNTCLDYEYARVGRYKMEGMITGNYEEILEPVEGGTRFTMKFDYQMPGGGVGKIVDRLFVEKMNAKNLEDSLKNLKAMVELKDSVSS
jgi:uncharacterized membrane protein